MATHDIRKQDRDSLARFLGWFSIGLGTAQVVAPRAMCRLIGADGNRGGATVMRLMGDPRARAGHGDPDAAAPDRLGVVARRRRRARPVAARARRAQERPADAHRLRDRERRRGHGARRLRGAAPLKQRSAGRGAANVIRKVVTINKTARARSRTAWSGRGRARAARSTRRARDVSFSRRPATAAPSSWCSSSTTPPVGEFGVAVREAHRPRPRDAARPTTCGASRRGSRRARSSAPTARPTGTSLADHLKQRPARPARRWRHEGAPSGRAATRSRSRTCPTRRSSTTATRS